MQNSTFFFAILCILFVILGVNASSLVSNLTNSTFIPRRFVDPLPFPKTLTAVSKNGDTTYYEVRIMDSFHTFHSDLPPTRIFGYEGVYPGPTIVVKQNERVQVKFINQIPQAAAHVIPIDTTIKGAEKLDVAIRSVVHLHGGFVAAEDDGHPLAWFTKDFNVTGNKFTKQVYTYENKQAPTALIYHDHAVGITRLNVMAGMIGLYVITPPDFSTFSPYDMPLLIQDKSFLSNGQMFYPTDFIDPMTGMSMSPSIVNKFFGDVIMVNGKIWPYLNVEPRKYRFRIANGCNGRTLNMTLIVDDSKSVISLNIVGSDQSPLDKVLSATRIVLSSAERIDSIVDFSPYAGKTITLTNVDVPNFPSSGNFTNLVMRFNVILPLNSSIPSISENGILLKSPIVPSVPTRVRVMGTSMQMDHYGRALHQFNKKSYYDPPTEMAFANSTEVWAVYNNDFDFDHPLHIHAARMMLLNRTFFDNDYYVAKGEYKWIGPTQQPNSYECGWKDVIRLAPSSLTYILVEFGSYTGEFVWHCHLLEHEEYDMMRPLIIQPTPKSSLKNNAHVFSHPNPMMIVLLAVFFSLYYLIN